jgi:hypothetical protein
MLIRVSAIKLNIVSGIIQVKNAINGIALARKMSFIRPVTLL